MLIFIGTLLISASLCVNASVEKPQKPKVRGLKEFLSSGHEVITTGLIPADEKTRFFVIGDFGSFTKHFGLQKSAQMMEGLASRKEFSHIITVGDNFYMNGIPDINQLWHPQSIMEVFNGPHASLLPFYATLGNHDCYSDYHNEILFSDYNRQWQMPSDYYELITPLKDNSGKYFVNLMLNSCKLMCFDDKWAGKYCKKMNTGSGSEAVLEHYKWLEEKLQKYSMEDSTAWLAVTLHHPPFLENALKEHFLPLIRKYKVDFIFTGHQHWADYANMDPDYITRFPPEEPQVINNCSKAKEFLFIENRDHTFYKGEKLHQILSGNGGTFLRKICPIKEQDGDLYFRNKGYNGVVAVEATKEKVTISYHRDVNDIVYQVNVINP
ncbi:unnamed protein product [Moneuplotes crassus]|uniref:Calcineurin-like phosphoesterase domain-containing protein n=1 Tax=Euplotes crassus TaxID=5936 RepID=A0AAD1XI33_EUPCR|nr:unnamed protein product [Moneuplotes crassus]